MYLFFEQYPCRKDIFVWSQYWYCAIDCVQVTDVNEACVDELLWSYTAILNWFEGNQIVII